jgi:UDPglucose 6-dehydrogenase
VKSVSIIGLGKLGSPMAACFAARGFRVHGVDLDATKVAALNRAVAPVHEPGLAELIREGAANLKASQDYEAAVHDSDATFIIVATPSEPGGGFSLQYALPTCEAIGNALRSKSTYHVVVITSTVMPGSTAGPVKAALERASGKRCGIDFGLCYSPEFIALGTVIRDFYHPDFLLIGESDKRAGEKLAEIYANVVKNMPGVARMNFINAEITKLAVNTYITTKISYANMLARLCEKLPDADVNVVTDALGLDTRIGAKYLKGAVSYGGPCFPRDNRALAALAASVGASSGLAEATDRFNRAQIKSVAEIVKSHHGSGAPIGILGLTYKPNTDVVEEAFGLLLAQELGSSGIPVMVYDPSANAERVTASGKNITFAQSAVACLAACGVVVVATPWAAFRDLPAGSWTAAGGDRTVIDCWRYLPQLENAPGIHYVRLGFGNQTAQPIAAGSNAD